VIPKGIWVLVLLITILAGRFTVVALEPWVGAPKELVKKGPRKPQRGLGGSASSAASEKRKSPPSPSSAASSAPVVRVQALLSVKHGVQRSEVYVNGELVGNTPYAGDLNCKRGEPVTVEIVPRRGPAIVRSPICRAGTIEVAEK
jgi:hypothetical protein